jgi:hypothetical protein
MAKYAFGGNRARQGKEEVEGSARVDAATAKHCEPRAFQRINRYGSLSKDQRFSLTIRSTDGCKLLETRVEHMHQAFQRLIDWSIDEIGEDVCAAISGPNGFYTNHRIKASRDFSWLENKQAISGASVQLRS